MRICFCIMNLSIYDKILHVVETKQIISGNILKKMLTDVS